MDVMADDPPNGFDQNGNAKKHNSVLTVRALSLRELASPAEVAYNDAYDHDDDAPFGDPGSGTEPGPERSPCRLQQGAVFSGKILSFCCSECKGDATYSPNDLLKHFQGAHEGTLPTYPCDLCAFVTHEFPSLQRHRIGHRDTLVTCEICNDGVQYSLLLLTRHFIVCHSCNGLFRCKTCDFSTRDAGTFVQHIHHHNEGGGPRRVRGPSASPTHGKVHGGRAHSGTFPFTCQFCGFGASWKEYLNKHVSVAHGDGADKANRWKAADDGSKVGSPGLKLLLKKNPPAGGSREPQWISQLNSRPGAGLLEHNGRLPNPEETLEETQQFLERAADADGGKRSKGTPGSERPGSCVVASSTAQPKTPGSEPAPGSGFLEAGGANGLTVLMVKNKISIPPNCTTKVMGFKMVDGKKHLVLKVIPTKPEPNSPSMSGRSGSALGLDSERKKDRSDLMNEARDSEHNNLDGPRLVDKHGAHRARKDVLETPALNQDLERPPSHDHELSCSQSQSADPTTEHISPNETSESDLTHDTAVSSLISVSGREAPATLSTVPCETITERTASQTSIKSTVGDDRCLGLDKSEPSLSVDARRVHTCPADDEPLQTNSANDVTVSTASFPREELSTGTARVDADTAPGGETLRVRTPARVSTCGDGGTGARAVFQDSPNREGIFSFHNYSKETFGSPPDLLDADRSPGGPEEDDCEENPEELKLDADWSLTLPASPPTGAERSEEPSLRTPPGRVSDGHGEVDGPPARDDGIETERKADERGVANLTSAAVLGKILEKHSDAIISQQLEKDRLVATAFARDANRPARTTLRILQTAEGAQRMFLRTPEAPYAVPVQLRGGPGFRLITKARGSQVNVSYMEPGAERPRPGAGLSLTLNGGRLGMSGRGPGGKVEGQPAVLRAANGSGGRYVVGAPAAKTPLLLSSPVKAAPGERQTCYLVHQPLPVSPGRPGSTSKALPVPRPVLAVPVSSADKAAPSQSGRQAYLVRYISQAKSGVLVNGPSELRADGGSASNAAGKNRVLVVRGPNGTRFLAPAPYTADEKPVYVAAGSLQSPYVLMSSDGSVARCSAGLNAPEVCRSASYRPVSAGIKDASPGKRASDARAFQRTPTGATGSRRPRGKRRAPSERPLEARRKTRRVSCVRPAPPRTPAAKDVTRTLRLTPLRPGQRVGRPRGDQPVVVLNHPDAGVPAATDIMESVVRYGGEVVRVTLSPATVRALSGRGPGDGPRGRPSPPTEDVPRPTSRRNVKERFILKLKLRKKNRRKYEVVRLATGAGSGGRGAAFGCWFCGRAFDNQEEWIGHGQRHLMEATRGWSELF